MHPDNRCLMLRPRKKRTPNGSEIRKGLALKATIDKKNKSFVEMYNCTMPLANLAKFDGILHPVSWV